MNSRDSGLKSRTGYFEFSPEVRDALENKKPVVALESTIVSFGLPYPDNIRVAVDVEECIRKKGAVPATIAVIGGKIKVGLERKELEFIAEARGVVKTSRRDLPYLVAKGFSGATTVSATMLISTLAGIKVFATGGLGGIHLGNPYDISQDLLTFRDSDMVVVSAGIKSVLDVEKTLEYMETHSLPVVGFRSREFPLFYSRKSGVMLDMVAMDAGEVASIYFAAKQLGLGSILVTNPIPEEDEIPADEMDRLVKRALADARREGVTGKAITPFLLQRLHLTSSRRTLVANVSLIKNNASLAADVAVEISNQEKKYQS